MVPYWRDGAFVSFQQNSEKRKLADQLLALQPEDDIRRPYNRYGTGFGKPNFPQSIEESTSLSDLVTEDSWFTLRLLKVDHKFLTEEVESWPVSPAYNSSLANVAAVNVINDFAERGVKLSSDFLSAAKTERHYQNVLQVVEEDRRQRPNLRKRKVKETEQSNQ